MDASHPPELLVPSCARSYASWILGPTSERWEHTRGVAYRAAELGGAVTSDQRELLVAAAWLHDIGYAEQLQRTGFHPLDGAQHLIWMGSWSLAVLVAHHSGARFIADYIGLSDELAAYPFADELAAYPFAVDALTDALTAADQTIGLRGREMTVDQRMEEMLQRHGPDSPQAVTHETRSPYLRAAVARTEHRLLRTLR